MKTAAFAVLALLCLQAAAGFDLKPKYEPKKPVYEPKKVVIVKPEPPKPSPKPSPKPVVHTVTCTPKPVIVAAAANVTCGAGYTLSQDPHKKAYTCTKEVCVLVAPKPVYEPKKPVYSKGHYFFGKKVEEKKPVYEPKKPVYEPKKAPAPVYKPKPVPSPVPSPAPKPVCHIEHADPIYVCDKGYTLQGKQCVLSTPGPCPPTYTASNGECVYSFTKPVYEPKKPVYEPKKGHYFFGKKLDLFKKAPAGPNYCADSLYPKPSPVHKPKYEPKKPVYQPKKVEIDPKKILGAVLSKFKKHD